MNENKIREKIDNDLWKVFRMQDLTPSMRDALVDFVSKQVYKQTNKLKKQLDEKEKELIESLKLYECQNQTIIKLQSQLSEKDKELSELKAKLKEDVETFIQFYEQSMKLQEHTADQHFIDWEDESIEGVLDFENAREKAFLIIKKYTQTHGQ